MEDDRLAMKNHAKVQKSLIWAVIVSETSHIFCCVLPTVFSLFSLLAGAGMIAVMPPFMVRFHDVMHHWELPMIAFSAAVLVFGWLAMIYHDRHGCDHGHDHDHGKGAQGHHHHHEEGCCSHSHHVHTGMMKARTARLVLKIATVLFAFNLLIYVGLHRYHWVQDRVFHLEEEHSHEGAGRE